eukprot:12860613-Alexandrium_andersonii.AAC.1
MFERCHCGTYQEHALARDTGEHLAGSRPLLVSRAGLMLCTAILATVLGPDDVGPILCWHIF